MQKREVSLSHISEMKIAPDNDSPGSECIYENSANKIDRSLVGLRVIKRHHNNGINARCF